MDEDSFLKRLELFVKENFSGDLHHGWPHLNRVRLYAKYLAEREGGDVFVVQVAALLHDIAKVKSGSKVSGDHASKGAEMAREILLSLGLSSDKVDEIVSCIRSHSRREPPSPKTLNEKIVFDADGLELVGAVGILRTALYAAYYNKSWRDMYEKVGSRLFENKFYTKTAREIVSNRKVLLEDFFVQLEKELSGSELS